MIQGFSLWLLATFVVEPVHAEWSARLATAGGSPGVVAEMARCTAEAGPALAVHAAGDPWWGVVTAAGVWLGTRDGMAVLAEATPLLAAPRS